MKTENARTPYLCWFITLALIMTIISFAYPFIIKFCTQNLNWQIRGTVGDTFGALNTLFSGLAFAGVIITIIMQRNELSLQRDEMIETRKEFETNRATNIVYNQLERFELAVKLLNIPESDRFKPEGFRAMLYLDSKKEIILRDDTLEQKKEKVLKAMTLYSMYGIHIQIFAIAAYNAMNVVKATLAKSNLPIDELNQLKDTFFRNIGSIQLGVIENITETNNLYYKLFDAKKKSDSKAISSINNSDLVRANIWLKKIVEFRNTLLTKEKIQEYNQNWIAEFGEHA